MNAFKRASLKLSHAVKHKTLSGGSTEEIVDERLAHASRTVDERTGTVSWRLATGEEVLRTCAATSNSFC